MKFLNGMYLLLYYCNYIYKDKKSNIRTKKQNNIKIKQTKKHESLSLSLSLYIYMYVYMQGF